jgi:hypothetical protein
MKIAVTADIFMKIEKLFYRMERVISAITAVAAVT